MNKIVIRKATVKDCPALLEIYLFYVEKTAITFEWEVPAVEEFENRIKNTLKKYPYLVAEVDGKIAGYAYASPFKERAAYDWSIETSIYVNKDLRQKKIGKTLLNELELILARQNVLNVNACIAWADVEDEYLTNDSVRFHEKMGYSMVGKFNLCGFKFNRWYSMVWMEKMIGEHKPDQKPFIPFSDLDY